MSEKERNGAWFFGCDKEDGHHETCTEFAGYADGKPGCACLDEFLKARLDAARARATAAEASLREAEALLRECHEGLHLDQRTCEWMGCRFHKYLSKGRVS